jgi:ABC-type uncharacterized transport system substrate-binding protein
MDHRFVLQRRLALLTGALGLAGVWPRAMAGGDDIQLVQPGDSPAQRVFTQALKARYGAMAIRPDLPEQAGGRKLPSLTILVGVAALRRALEQGYKGQAVAVLISSQAYHQLLGQAPREQSNITALLSDPPAQAQMQLIATLFDRGTAVGTLLSESSLHLERSFRQAAAQYGHELLVERVEAGGSVMKPLQRLAAAQVILAVPDATIYTPDTLRAILESTYRKGQPMVGFSPATVTAGTLASAYSDIEDLVMDLSEVIDTNGWLINGSLHEARTCRYWRMQINDNVARSLGVSVSDKVLKLGNRAGKGGL